MQIDTYASIMWILKKNESPVRGLYTRAHLSVQQKMKEFI